MDQLPTGFKRLEVKHIESIRNLECYLVSPTTPYTTVHERESRNPKHLSNGYGGSRVGRRSLCIHAGQV